MTEKVNKKLQRLGTVYMEKRCPKYKSHLPEPTNISYISLQNVANQIRRETHQAGSTFLWW